MLYGQDRASIRRFFLQVWDKHRREEPLEPMERVMATVMEQHPEYHRELADMERALGREYPAEAGRSNPFLHMGMHIAIQEQVATDRPPGIAAAYGALCVQCGDPHEAEHRIMECLGEALWESQRQGIVPDEQKYLEQVCRLAGSRQGQGNAER